MSHGGKGYVQRPTGVDEEVMQSNWDAIFGRKAKASACKETCSQKEAKCQKDSTYLGEEEASNKESG